ncbi:MAG TPA: phosphate-starvation-inducible PsiE family protein [Acidocella sp.]|nr:phosphate-starvation-inducible PsiE family protein [Acidocella sp.]
MQEPSSTTKNNPFIREFAQLSRGLRESSLYDGFQQLIVLILTMLIMVITAVATITLVKDVWDLVWQDQINLANSGAFEAVFGNIFTVIIALEFKSSLRASFVERKEVVRGRTIMLIALLAVARKFIILDLQSVSSIQLFALAATTLALGVVYWLIREQDSRLLSKKISAESHS